MLPCEQDHPPDRCRYKKAVSRNCGKIGHIQRACRSQGRQHWGKPQTGAVKSLHLEDAEESEELVEYKLNTVVGERDISSNSRDRKERIKNGSRYGSSS